MDNILITDIDNTLYDWIDFFAPSFRAMVHALSPLLKKSEDDVYEEFKSVNKDNGSLEFRGAIQQLDSFVTLNPDERSRAFRAGYVAFGKTRRRRLSLYPGTRDTLRWLRDQGVRIIGVTNSPITLTIGRLRSLSIEQLFDSLAGWDAPTEDSKNGLVSRTNIPMIVPLRQNELKPNKVAFERAMSNLQSNRKTQLWSLGDSRSKDLYPTAEIRAKTIWARYGKHAAPENLETLVRITFWSKEQIEKTYEDNEFRPDYIIDSIEELKNIFPRKQGELRF